MSTRRAAEGWPALSPMALSCGAAIAVLAGCGDQQLQPCSLPEVTGKVECGFVTVPESPGPGASDRTIRLHVVQLGAFSDAGSRAPVVLLVGGPGQAATEFAAGFEGAGSLRDTRNVLLIDQRGTGQSHPLECGDELAGGPGVQFHELLPVDFVTGCAHRLAASTDLDAYGTEATASDLLRVLDALGIEAVNLVAYSYGTRVALAAARQAPDRIRAMALSGLAPPDLRIPASGAEDLDSALLAMDRDCGATRSACPPAPPDGVLSLAREIAARLDRAPAALQVRFGGGVLDVALTRGAFGYALRGMLYGPRAAELPALLKSAGTPEGLRPFAEYFVERSGWVRGELPLGLYLSVICAEDVPGIDLPAARAAARETVLQDWMLTAYVDACAVWPVRPRPQDLTGMRLATPALVLAGAHDPVTPPRYARAAMDMLPNGSLLVFAGAGHSIAPECTRAVLRDFLDAPGRRPVVAAACPPQADR